MIDRYKPLIYNYKLGVFSLPERRKNIAGMDLRRPVIQFVDAHGNVQNGG